MQLEVVAIVLSIFSTVVALVDVYFNQFRRGRVVMPPTRMYRLEPLNFHADGESYRAVRLTTALTFVNTGALTRVVDNLRIRFTVPGVGHTIVLDWRDEHETVEGDAQSSRFAVQPSVGPYSSISKVYSFVSRFLPSDGRAVSALEDYGTQNPQAAIPAAIEMLSDDKWTPLRTFNLRYSGANAIERDFERINR